jgi:hypothetical protein
LNTLEARNVPAGLPETAAIPILEPGQPRDHRAVWQVGSRRVRHWMWAAGPALPSTPRCRTGRTGCSVAESKQTATGSASFKITVGMCEFIENFIGQISNRSYTDHSIDKQDTRNT